MFADGSCFSANKPYAHNARLGRIIYYAGYVLIQLSVGVVPYIRFMQIRKNIMMLIMIALAVVAIVIAIAIYDHFRK